jgi:ABC-2 type transport system ATP-binding protein
MRQFIKDYNQRHGATVILTSHYMEDVAALCPRIIVIDKGHLVYDGDLRGLARRMKPEKRITVRLARPEDAPALTLVGLRIGKLVRQTDTEVVLSVTADKLNDSLRELLSALPATDLSVEDPPLEEVMREVFQQGRPTAPAPPEPAEAPAAGREVQP